ncbi:MAG: hypothetical protein AAFU85_26900 [Planctomycetota bacterium]
MSDDSRFDAAFNRARSAEERAFGVSVRLSRGGMFSEVITARYGVIEPGGAGFGRGVSGKLLRRVWHLPISSTTIQGTPTTPQPGDCLTQIDQATGSTGASWEIEAPDESTPAVHTPSGSYDHVCQARQLNE